MTSPSLRSRVPRPLVVLALLGALPAAVPVLGQCLPAEAPDCVLLLEGEGAPARSAACVSEAWARHLKLQQPLADRNGDGSHEAVVSLDLDLTKGCARVRLELELGDDPTRFLVDLGDSIRNDGHSGGPVDRPDHCAEVQVDRFQDGLRLRVYSDDIPGAWGAVEELLVLDLDDLPRPSLALEVSDQQLVIELPVKGGGTRRMRLRTPVAGLLFSLSGQPVPRAGAAPPDRRVHVGLNRVIAKATDAPERARFGRGLRRATFRFLP
ncbi:MAG: hypothetical protein AAF533_20655 [Acidobacteriota bacterium]